MLACICICDPTNSTFVALLHTLHITSSRCLDDDAYRRKSTPPRRPPSWRRLSRKSLRIAQVSPGCVFTVGVYTRANVLNAVFKLPDETFLDILSYFPVINFRYKIAGQHRIWGANVLPGEYVERLDVLRAITQTCRMLRQKFLSWLWERVEACVVPNFSAWYIYVGNVLESKCHILLKNPSLTTHVRSVEYLFPLFCSILRNVVDSVMSVTISRYRMDTILPAFVDCVKSLPNLHTLELCHVHHWMTTKLRSAFEGTVVPSIRTVVLPTIAHHLLASCPNVEDVTCNVGDGSQILGTIASKCPKVTRISGTSPSQVMLKRLLAPNNPC